MRAIVLILIMILSGCTPKVENVTINGVIDSVNGNTGIGIIEVTGGQFDKASVDFISGMEIDFELSVGQSVKIEILPEIRESYPVQVTAVSIKLVEKKAEYTKITPEKAKDMMNKENVIILDVRTEEEYAEKRIENAILIPDYDIETLAPEKLTDKKATILVYCRSGRRSKAASEKLIELGYESVYDFGGINDWTYDTVSG